MKKLLLLCLTLISLIGYSQIELPSNTGVTWSQTRMLYNNAIDTLSNRINDLEEKHKALDYEVWQLQKPKYCDSNYRKNQRDPNIFWEQAPFENYLAGTMIIGTYVLVSLADPHVSKHQRDMIALTSMVIDVGTFVLLRSIRIKRDKKCLMWN